MPRNGSGVYSKPAGTTAIADTTIESSKYNSTIDDLVADANAARPIVAGGTGATSASTARTALAVPGLATDNSMSGINTHSKIVKWAKGADVASASTLTLGDDGNYFDITGTTAITAIATKGVGTVVKLHFDASLTLTHNATDLILPGGANIVTAAGDEAEFVEYATGDWRCVNYSRADGRALTAPAALAGRNLIINGQGRINQRSYVSGTNTTGANQFTLDRWFVVTSGQNLSFTGDDSRREMTAPAGGVSQVIEGNAIVGGTYVLNWTGTATATVNGTARTKGETFTLTANTNATIRFSSGTFTDVQLELSSVPTAYERMQYAQELVNCLRFAEAVEYVIFSGSVTSGQTYYVYAPFKVKKRAAVTDITFTSIGATGFNTADPSTGGVSGIDGLRLSKSATSTVTGGFFIYSLFASAELTS